MLDHLELLLGFVGAVATAERLLLGVRQVVMSETRRPPESLRAQPARVWPIIAVLALVSLQYEASLEGFAALLANIRAHITVLRVAVCAESVCSVSAVVALITGVRLLSCRRQTLFKSVTKSLYNLDIMQHYIRNFHFMSFCRRRLYFNP